MFEFFFRRRKPAEPFTDLRSATRWFQDLAPGDSLAAHAEIVRVLHEYNAQRLPPTRDRIQALLAIDEGAQEVLAAIASQYLANARMPRAVESRLWHAMVDYFQEILQAHHTHVMAYVADPAGSPVRPFLPLLIARVVYYLGEDAKWCFFRYQRANPRVWKHMHKLYHLAEYEEIERSPLQLFAAARGPFAIPAVTIEQLYLRALLLDVVHSGNMLPRRIDLVDRWLLTFSAEVHLDKEFAPLEHTYYVDLEKAEGARRVRRVEPTSSKRYWSTRPLVDRLSEVREAMRGGALPARLGLTEDCRPPGCLELLDRVTEIWSLNAPRARRAFARMKSLRQAEVVHGMREICAHVRMDNERLRRELRGKEQQLSYDKMLDMYLYGFVTARTRARLVQASKGEDLPAHVHERWVIEDESPGGYGATIERQENDWVRIDRLVGIRPERRGYWQVAVVRRLSQIGPAELAVGLELLADRPVVLVARLSRHQDSGYTVDGVDMADLAQPHPLVFSKGGGQGKDEQPDSLLIESANYAPERELWFNASGHVYRIALGQVLERADEWLKVGFRVLSREPYVEAPPRL